MANRHIRAWHFAAWHFLAVGAAASGEFSDTVAAYLQGKRVNVRPLAELDFRDGVERVWGGEYVLTSGGVDWKGLGRIASVDGLDQAASLESSVMTFTLSGVEVPGADLSYLALATSEDRSNYVDRISTVHLQFFEITGDTEWEPLDAPYALKAAIMTSVSVSRVRKDNGHLRTVSLQANNLFFGRSIPRGATYTDRDQQLRAPGDKGMQFIPSLQNNEIPVPWR
jgi:hypothetical protein